MKHRGRIVHLGMAAAAVGMIMLPAGAHAGPQLPAVAGTAYSCQQQLEIQVGILHTKIYGAMQKCKDAIRKEINIGILTGLGTNCVKTGTTPQQIGGCMAKAAHLCENYLKPVYQAGTASPFTAAYVQTFKNNIEKLRNGHCRNKVGAGGSAAACNAHSQCAPTEYCDAKCTDEVLPFTLTQDGSTLQHLVSGVGGYAPPVAATCANAKGGPADPTCASTYLQDFLLFATEKYAIKQQLMNVPDMLALFQDAVGADPAEKNGVNGNINTVRVPLTPSGSNLCNAGTCALDPSQTCTTAADCTKIPSTTYKGTSCALPGGTNANLYELRPNLCHFGVECRDHVCALAQKAFCNEGACTAANAETCCVANPGDCCDDINNCPECITPVPYSSFLGVSLTGGFDLRVPVFGALAVEVCRPGRPVGECKGTGTCGGAGDPCQNPSDCTSGGNTPPCTLAGNGDPCAADADCPSGTGPCNLASGEGAGYTFMTQDNFLYLINQPSKTLAADTSSLPSPLNQLLAGGCVVVTRSEGYCDCLGTGLPKNFTFCQDHVTGAVPPDGGTPPTLGDPDACGFPVTPFNPDPKFDGTLDGIPVFQSAGATTAGDCIDLVAAQFSLLTSPTDFGPDGIPCTEDDFAAPTPPFALPLTSGTATAALHNAVAAAGACSAGSSNPGDPCVQDVTCPGGTCDGEAIQALLSVGATGGTGTCDQYGASNLSGLGLAGAIAASADPVGDVGVAFRFGCK